MAIDWNDVRYFLALAMLPCYVADRDPSLRRLARADCRHVANLWLVSHPDLRENARSRAARDCVVQALLRQEPLFQGQRPNAGADSLEP